MLIGYVRVSTHKQDSSLQRDALLVAGLDPRNIFEDVMSGTRANRPKLQEALNYLQSGDTFIVWKLDRLGRSLHHLIETITHLATQGIGFRSLTEQIDTTTSGGKLIFHIFGSMAQFERDLLSERTHAGLKAARIRGRVGGRPHSLDAEQKELVKAMKLEGKPIAVIARTFKTSRQTIYRTVNDEE